MKEIGLVRLAGVSLRIAREVMPAHRSKYSKRLFTQPQLLAILCLMRYEDWTLREAEVRLSEHAELRAVLELKRVPDYSTLARFIIRLDEEVLARALAAVAKKFPSYRGRRATVAIDATGLSPGALSTFFVRRRQHHSKKPMPWTHWLKWLVVVDVSSQILLAQSARSGPVNDCAQLPSMVEAAHQIQPIGRVLADAEFDSERNHQHIRQVLKAQSIIPAKRGKKTWKIHGIRARMRESFPKKLYGPRSLIETVFSTIKRKLSNRAPGKSLLTQRRQALLLGLTYNLYRLRCPTIVS